MSRYGGIVQPDHSDLVCRRSAGRARLLHRPRFPRYLRGTRVPLLPRAWPRQGRIRYRVAAGFLSRRPGPGTDLAVRRQRPSDGEEAAVRGWRPLPRGAYDAEPGLAVPGAARPDAERRSPPSPTGQRITGPIPPRPTKR